MSYFQKQQFIIQKCLNESIIKIKIAYKEIPQSWNSQNEIQFTVNSILKHVQLYVLWWSFRHLSFLSVKAPTHVETCGDTCIDFMKPASESICLHTSVFRVMPTLKYVFQNVESSFSSNIIVNTNKRYVFPIRRYWKSDCRDYLCVVESTFYYLLNKIRPRIEKRNTVSAEETLKR